MFTIGLLHTSPTRPPLLVCRFPYAERTAFKEAVPDTDRFWRPELKAWEVTICGFHALCENAGERLDPLPYAVLEFVYPSAVERTGERR